MDILIDILAVICGLVGIIGTIIPVLPGPVASYLGMGILYIWGSGVRDDITMTVMIIWLVITIAVSVFDFIVPAYFTKKHGGSKSSSRAAIICMILASPLFPPIGMIIASFLGALFAEIVIEGKERKVAIKAAFGSFIGFLVGTGIKLIATVIMMYYIIIGIA